MLTEIEMDALAKKYIAEMSERIKIELTLLTEYEIKKEYGKMYVYTSKMYKETGEFRHAIVGNAPFLVEKETGRIIVFGTAESDEYYIKEYEEGRWPNNRR